MGGGRTTNPPPSEAGRLRPPQQRSRVFWNTEPLLRNGERKVSDEFSLRPTRDPSARRRKLTPDAKHPSSHPRLRRPKGALCFTHRPPRIRKSARSPNGDCPRRRHQASRIVAIKLTLPRARTRPAQGRSRRRSRGARGGAGRARGVRSCRHSTRRRASCHQELPALMISRISARVRTALRRARRAAAPGRPLK